ncbi:MAG: creatininase family protein, partial [Thermaerobacterales bacterium]
VEAHGPHGLIGTDHFAAGEVAARAAAKCNAIALPSVPFGYCEGTMDFPGTITIDPEPYKMVLENIVRSLHKWGIRRIVWITGHGPNGPLMKHVSLEMRRELGMLFAIPLWYRLAIQLLPDWNLGPDHGGFTETSVAMAVRPGNANLKEAEDGCIIRDIGGAFDSQGKYDITFKDAGIDIPLMMRERWPLAYWDVSMPGAEASVEAGEEILRVVTDYLAEFADEFRQLPLDLGSGK